MVELRENMLVAVKYRLNRMIGRGGMGSVWHATQTDLDRPCAIKFIEGEYAGLPEAQERFKREAVAAAKIKSEHIVEIYEHGIWEQTPFIAMELLEGEDLGRRLARIGRISPGELNFVMSQVCRALGKAHKEGIVHRDIKPDNIFIIREDDREVAKVVDFGIAKLGTNPLEGSKTRTGAMLGTPYYMSPEQAQGTRAVDPRSDLWSLAIICYQALVGKLPFESEALGDLLVKIIVAPIPIPSQMASVPIGFDRWFERAANRDPDKRFQTAREFADALTLALGASSVTDVMNVAEMRALLPSGQFATNPGMFTPVPGNAASQPGLGQLSASQPGMPTMTGVTNVHDVVPKKKPGPALFVGVGLAALLVAGGGIFALKGGSKANATASPVVTATQETKPPASPATTSVQAVDPPVDHQGPAPSAKPASSTEAEHKAAQAKVEESKPVHKASGDHAAAAITKPVTTTSKTAKPKTHADNAGNLGF